MEWTEKLATGISTIDSQHKELFNLKTAVDRQFIHHFTPSAAVKLVHEATALLII